MKRNWVLVLVLAMFVSVVSAHAQTQRLIVRDKLGLKGLQNSCLLLGCNVVESLGDPLGQLFLINVSNALNLNKVLQLLPLQLGVEDIELDQVIGLIGPTIAAIPQQLNDSYPVNYYGRIVWHGYVTQPGNQLIRTSQTQSAFHVSGTGIVAIIDTGVDATHPALAGVLLKGYDFTRNSAGADETGDLNHSTAAVLDGGGGTPVLVNSSVAAVVSKQAAAALNNSAYSAFGHGTMTAGLVHLIAPTAKLLPLKAFSANGTGYESNVIRALYYATANSAKVVSMSFDFATASQEMTNAINYANSNGLICVASAGNDSKKIKVYPASFPTVMGVASTSDKDIQSTFSNYGPQVVWVAAPGEDMISTYPGATYASSSGTSFSAPLVAGTAALLVNVSSDINQSTASSAIAHAKWLSTDLNNGRLDTYQAVNAWFNAVTKH
jgi:subtilisin family serine protease